MKNVNFEKQIIQIMENFDFNKVKKTMKFLKWSWFDTPKNESPSINKLKETALSLLEEASKSKEKFCYVSTGGFKAVKIYNRLALSFEVEEHEFYEI